MDGKLSMWELSGVGIVLGEDVQEEVGELSGQETTQPAKECYKDCIKLDQRERTCLCWYMMEIILLFNHSVSPFKSSDRFLPRILLYCMPQL